MGEGGTIGQYRVTGRIGQGGMGAVYAAEHVLLGRPAAIKVLLPEFTRSPDMVQRFFNEARAATAIRHPGIVEIYDFGWSDGAAFIVMEHLQGETLAARSARRRLGWRDALVLVRQIAGALAAAHAKSIVHRDLKPDNVFLVADPEVPGGERIKLLDFGIAKLVGDTAPQRNMTRTGAVMGTPTYMSPEQCRGVAADHRADLYALGCIAFELCCGRPPFVGEGSGDVLAAHIHVPAPSLGSLAADVPAPVAALVDRLLAKAPDDRVQSAAALIQAIEAILAGVPGGRGDRGDDREARAAAASPSSEVATLVEPRVTTTLSGAAQERTKAPRARRRGRTVAIVAAAAVVVGAGVELAMHGRDAATSPAPPARVVATPPVEPPPVAAPPPVATPPSVAAPSRAPDPAAELGPRMRDVLARFLAWSRGHAGAACPDLDAIGAGPGDPWGHRFRLTCTDQPADQIAGVVSAGPDGRPGTDDDVASWQLGHDVTDVVRGSRWTPGPAAVVGRSDHHPRGASAPAGKKPGDAGRPAHAPTTAQPTPAVELDDNGLPVSR